MIKFIPGSRLYPEIKESLNARMAILYDTDETQESYWTKQAEMKLELLTGRKHAFLCTSGTSAIQMMLMAHDVGPGDEVLCTNYSCPATVMPIKVLGATPVFQDINEFGQQDFTDVKNYITPKTKAILATGLYGDNYDYDLIKDLGYPILNDSAQSWLGQYKGVENAKLGDMSILSFSGNKNCPVFGTYGAVLTDSDELAERIFYIRRNGYKHRDLGIQRIGINSQPHEDKAIQVLCSLEQLHRWQKRRVEITDYYVQRLTELEIQMRPTPDYCRTSAHKDAIFVHNNHTFRDAMNAEGVDCRLHYTYNFGETPQLVNPNLGAYPITDWYGKHTVTIPGNPFMTDAEVETVIEKIKKIATREDRNLWPSLKSNSK
jgi:dTDP-4-amino-4,6-dideoxygalactose transaminase